MKIFNYILMLCTVLVLFSCDLEGIEEVEPEPLTVYDVLNRQNKFGQFLRAAEKANIMDLLQGSDAYTWFIPNDSAFADLNIDINSLNSDELRSILEYHIIPGDNYLIDLQPGYQSTLAGDSFWLKANINELTGSVARLDLNQFRNQTLFNNYNLNAVNGRINEVSFVMVPPIENTWQVIQNETDLSSFVQLVNKAGLSSLMQNDSPLTVFAPINDALSGVDIENLTVSEASTLVNDHIIETEPIYLDDVENGLSVRNNNNNELIFGEGSVNSITINEVDLISNNGVTHKIDDIIIF